MTTPIQNLRSNVDSKRPTASGLAFGQIAINYNENDPAIYLRGDSDALVKIAPVYIASGAPNATPASGGTSGNSIGEQWLDISTSPATLKLWDGSNWLSPGATSIASGVIVDADVNASAAIAGTKIDPDFGSQTIETTGVINAGSGTEAAPSVSVGTTDNGLYSPGTDQVAISTNGTGRLFVNANGTLSTTSTNAAVASFTGPNNSYVDITDGTETFRTQFVSNVPGIGTVGSTALLFRTNNTEKARITSDGTFQHKGNGSTGSPGSPAVGFNGSAPSNSLVIDSTGKVGLGTSSPSTLLHIQSTAPEYKITNTTSQATTNGNAAIATITAEGQRNNVYGNVGSITWRQDDRTYSSVDTVNKPTRLEFCTQDNSTTDQSSNPRMVIDFQGKVGIGVTSPGHALEVNGNIQGSNFLATSAATFGVASNTRIGIVPTTVTNERIEFYVGTTERARIDSSGRLLVGTSSDSLTSTVVLQGNSGSATGTCALRLCRGQNNPSLDTVLGYLTWGDSGHTPAAWIAGVRDTGTWTSGVSQPTRLEFSVTADGASSPTERVRIASNGITYIGNTTITTSSQQTTAPHAIIYSNGSSNLLAAGGLECNTTSTSARHHISFTNPNGVVGSISTSASATAYNTSSDYRLKENVVPLTGAADRLNQLQVHRFNFIADPDTTVDGFIAHEAQEVVPECVTGTKDEVDADGNPVYQGIDQSKLVPLLTAALQEALAEIESLKARLTAAGI